MDRLFLLLSDILPVIYGCICLCQDAETEHPRLQTSCGGAPRWPPLGLSTTLSSAHSPTALPAPLKRQVEFVPKDCFLDFLLFSNSLLVGMCKRQRREDSDGEIQVPLSDAVLAGG